MINVSFEMCDALYDLRVLREELGAKLAATGNKQCFGFKEEKKFVYV